MESKPASRRARKGPELLWGAMQRTASVAVYGAHVLVGRELVRTLLEAGHPPRKLRLFGEGAHGLTWRGETLAVEPVPAEPSYERLAFVCEGGPGARALVSRLVDAGSRVVDCVGATGGGDDVPWIAPGVGTAGVGAFTQLVSVANGPAAWLAPILAVADRAYGLEDGAVTWLAPAAAEGLEALLALRARRTGEGPGAPRTGESGVVCGTPRAAADSLRVEGRVLGSLLGRPELPLDVAVIRVPLERVDGVQASLRTHKAMTVAEAAGLLARIPGVEVVAEPGVPAPEAVAGSSSVQVGCIRTGVRGAGSLSFLAMGDHLLAGTVRAALAAASLFALG